jgi:hypothetical protein
MEEDSPLNRRTVVKGIGAAALLGTGLAGTASTAAATPGDLKIQSGPYVDKSNIDNAPKYFLTYGAKLKDESAPYGEYTAYGVFKLHNWQDSVEELEIVGPIELGSPASETVNNDVVLRGKPNRWYRATFTLLVTDSAGEVAFGDTAITNFKYDGP